jgi:hypothetical protein
MRAIDILPRVGIGVFERLAAVWAVGFHGRATLANSPLRIKA